MLAAGKDMNAGSELVNAPVVALCKGHDATVWLLLERGMHGQETLMCEMALYRGHDATV